MAASSKSATIAELRRMFSNLDSTVIESVLAANNGQLDVTIDHLLTMSIDTENENNIQQVKKYRKKKFFFFNKLSLWICRQHQQQHFGNYQLFLIYMMTIHHLVN
jgi:hypothetical protein